MEISIFHVGIVGSRRRNTLRDRKIVIDLVERIIRENVNCRVILVSGGARGPDTFAEDAASVHGVGALVFPVISCDDKNEFRSRAYARNSQIAKVSDVLYALVHPDRKGGTEDTIRKALSSGKNVFLVDEEGNILSISGREKNEGARSTD